jgi:hypothetical protein
VLAPGAELARVFPADRAPLWFGPAPGAPPLGRFDDPMRHARDERDARDTFGTCYLGRSREAAFAESFLRRPRTRLLSRAMLDARGIARLVVVRPLRLVALHGPGLAAVHATAAVTHGPHAVSRRWARALWRHRADRAWLGTTLDRYGVALED